jgi:hypothetical protein
LRLLLLHLHLFGILALRPGRFVGDHLLLPIGRPAAVEGEAHAVAALGLLLVAFLFTLLTHQASRLDPSNTCFG